MEVFRVESTKGLQWKNPPPANKLELARGQVESAREELIGDVRDAYWPVEELPEQALHFLELIGKPPLELSHRELDNAREALPFLRAREREEIICKLVNFECAVKDLREIEKQYYDLAMGKEPTPRPFEGCTVEVLDPKTGEPVLSRIRKD